jgi:hypothetical protein
MTRESQKKVARRGAPRSGAMGAVSPALNIVKAIQAAAEVA